MSIRRYLVLILLSVITLVTFIAAIQGYKASMDRASKLFDVELSDVAQTLAVIPVAQPTSSLATQGELAFQLWQDKALVLKTDNAPVSKISDFTHGFSEQNFNGQRWRILVKHVPDTRRWVMVAQPLKKRFLLAEEVILSAVTPIIIAIPLLTLLISFAIRQGLKPLTDLNNQLKSKKANDLSLLETHRADNELTPIVGTLNQLFERLSAAFERERHFASDAAHELRTPLSVLKINVFNLANELQGDSQALQDLASSVDRMAHVVDQILTLNRTSPEQISIDSEAVDIKALMQECIADIYPEIANRAQDISLQCDDIILTGNKFSLGVLLQNLITNAVKYTPSGGEIRVSASVNNAQVTILVEDTGPGIKAQEFERVFNRFYRVGGDQHKSAIIGCGLGLAIVKHIVDLHQGSIALSKSNKLKGLKVCVTLPQSAVMGDIKSSMEQDAGQLHG